MDALLLDWLLVAGMVFGGCCSNVWTLEIALKQLPKTTTLITFLQFLTVSVEGLHRFLRFSIASSAGKLKSDDDNVAFKYQLQLSRWNPLNRRLHMMDTKIPRVHWLVMVSLFWSVSILNNWALEQHIDMMLHIIFKSSGLFVNLIFGYLLTGKRYSWKQVLAVVCVSVGVFLCTFLTSTSMAVPKQTNFFMSLFESSYISAYFGRSYTRDALTLQNEWIWGIVLMTVSLVLSAFLGLYQEHVYTKYGKEWREGLFYTHFYALPFFLLFYKDLFRQLAELAASSQVVIAWVVVNSLTQLICIAGVHKLSSFANSLTVNLFLTFRKFISLIISIIYFGKTFTTGHLIGALLVFAGTVLYSFAPPVKVNRNAFVFSKIVLPGESDKKKRP